jgi:hypothetical protein
MGFKFHTGTELTGTPGAPCVNKKSRQMATVAVCMEGKVRTGAAQLNALDKCPSHPLLHHHGQGSPQNQSLTPQCWRSPP